MTKSIRATALTGRGEAAWHLAEQRLSNAEKPRTCWLATVNPDGTPHLMPLITAWVEGALYFLTSEGSQKGRNLSHQPRCVVAMSSTTLPSLDLVLEGNAEQITDAEDRQRAVDLFSSKLEWPLEVRADGVYGPNAPTAGPPPYVIVRLVPDRVFGLPGMLGMENFQPDELPKPTRWDLT